MTGMMIIPGLYRVGLHIVQDTRVIVSGVTSILLNVCAEVVRDIVVGRIADGRITGKSVKN